MAHRVTFIPGDGTGPEIADATRRVLEASGAEFEWDVQQAGADVMDQYGGNPLPDHVLDSIKRNVVALKGPITTPVGTGFRSVNVALRKTLDLFGQVRPCKSYPGVRSGYEQVDLVIVRENTEDLYAGIEFEEGTDGARELIAWMEEHGGRVRPDSGISIKPISATGTRRIVQIPFDYAGRNCRRKVTAVHKANIMKFTDGLFLQTAREVAEENAEVEFEDRIVDNLSMQLVQRPEEYDVLVCPNLYGDIVSDLAAGLIGGLGLAPGGNFGTEAAVFEPTHGSAPKYAGQNKVNPMAMMLSGVMMLRHLEERDAADRLEAAIAEVIADGTSVTYDMKATRDDATAVGTSEVADVVVVDIKEGLAEGKALDINSAAPILGYQPTMVGSNSYEETAGSDIVVVTAGVPRTGDMSRDDLVTTNEGIVGSVTREAVERSPEAILIVVSNPLDAMCHVAKDVSSWPRERVFGMAGILDTARFRTFIAWETGSSPKDVTAMVLGGHGDQMVPVVSATTVGGVPLRSLVSDERIEAMVERTRKGGGEIVKHLGTSAWYAPGAAVARMVDAVMLDQKRVLPCTAYLQGEYAIDDLFMGVPVKLGAGGIEEIVELDLDADERATLEESAAAVREVVSVLTA